MARGALLLKRPSPFAFPGGTPGFDPGHVASQGMAPGHGFSTILGQAQAVDILRPNVPSVTYNGAGGMTTSIDGRIGPTSANAAGHGSRWFDSGISLANDQQATMAAIVVTPGSFTNGEIVSVGWGTIHANFRTNSAGNLQSNSAVSAFALAASTPYFTAVSLNTTTANFIAVNLRTGQVLTDTQSGSYTFSAPDLALITLLSNAGGVEFLGPASVLMYAPNFLSKFQLIQWSQDPWSFWYP